MRVIAGTKRHFKLKTIESLQTRPTLDHIKEMIFNVIAFELADSLFLDLFAGSGGMGIEALSRNARCAYFVENSADCVQVIRDNLAHTGFTEKAVLLKKDVLHALDDMRHVKFDFVFMDPPYSDCVYEDVLYRLLVNDLLNANGKVIIEHASATVLNIENIEYNNRKFVVCKEKAGKKTKVTFLGLQ